MIDRGTGTPIVLIPGLQGRWEWTRPAVSALSKQHRVITYSLCDERTSPFACDPSRGFENYLDQLDQVFERAKIDRAVIAGVSYGGLIATEYAARHPERVQGLVLACALHKTWQPNSQQSRYLKSPVLMSPMFVATAPQRLGPEMSATFPSVFARLKFTVAYGANVMFALASPVKMARRIEWAHQHDFADPRTIEAPTLIVTGEPELDRVVPVDVTRRYLHELRTAQHVVMKRTGHSGYITRPDEFADLLGRFVNGVRIPA